VIAHKHGVRRTARAVLFGLCLAAAASLSGCIGASLLYNHADWLLTRQLDHYFDLTRPQRAFLSARLNVLLERHRQEALPRYEEVVRQAVTRIERGVTLEDVDWAFRQYDHWRTDLMERFTRDGADFLQLVRDAQLPHVKEALRQRLAKQEALLREPKEKRLAAQTDRLLALIRDWLGPVSREQEWEITQLAMAFPDAGPAVYTHQARRHDELMALLEERATQDTGVRLRNWLIDRESDPAFLETTQRARTHLTGLLLALDRMATPLQRRYVLSKLDDLAHTVHRLHSHT